MASLNMKITNSFFNPRPSTLSVTTTHTTWRNPSASKSQHMLDVFSCSNTFFNRVPGCNPTKKEAEIDHTVVILKIHINKLAFKMKHKKLTTKTDWEKIMTDKTTDTIYKEKLKELISMNKNNNSTQEEYTNYFKYVKNAGKETVTKTSIPPMDWFKMSQVLFTYYLCMVHAFMKLVALLPLTLLLGICLLHYWGASGFM
jgi:hypothetical protein